MKVLLACSSQDEIVDSIQAELEEQGHEVWRDEADFSNGGGPRTGLEAIVRNTDALVILFSPNLLESVQRLHEGLRQARTANVQVVPVYLKRMRRLPEQLQLDLAGTSRVELFVDFEAGMERLAKTLAQNESPADRPSLRDRAREGARRVRVLARTQKGDLPPSDADTEETPRGAKVFLSYSRRDELAKNVQSELEERGHVVWRDQTNIAGGADWRASIEAAIRDADVFILLISPSLVRNPNHAREELELARAANKEIIPVYLKRVKTLPPAFDLILSGRQFIELFTGFDAGMERLFSVLGESIKTDPDELTLGERARRLERRAKIFAQEYELASKAKKYGGTAAVGALAALALVAKGGSKQQEEAQRQRAAALREAIEAYRTNTHEFLRESLRQINLAAETPADYELIFRPKIQRLLGRLEAMQAPTPNLVRGHEELVRNLRRLLDDLEDAMLKVRRGDYQSAQRAIERLNTAWSATVASHLEWLVKTAGQA